MIAGYSTGDRSRQNALSTFLAGRLPVIRVGTYQGSMLAVAVCMCVVAGQVEGVVDICIMPRAKNFQMHAPAMFL